MEMQTYHILEPPTCVGLYGDISFVRGEQGWTVYKKIFQDYAAGKHTYAYKEK